MSAQPFTILVVCVGNVCRSPTAERLLARDFSRLLGPADLPRVGSAGVRALVGEPMNDLSARELVRLGGDPSGFVSRQLTKALVEESDLVLTATRDLRSRLLEDAPRALKRTFTIPELSSVVSADDFWDVPNMGPDQLVSRAATMRGTAAPGDYDVPDPIGRPPAVHREVARQLEAACSAIAAAVVRSLTSNATA